jgi:hypothetical protein
VKILSEKEIIIKIENQGKRVFINKGTESVWLDIDYDKGTIDISATHRSGGYSVASLKFYTDQVVKID